MSNTITLKKSGVSGNAPASADLSLGEIALNYADGHLYYKSGASATPAKINAGDADNADTVDGFHLNQNVLTTSTPTFDKLRLTNGSDASLTSTLHAFQIGASSGQNLIIDNNEIVSRSNGAASVLYLQNDGGDVMLGTNGGTSRLFVQDGTATHPAIAFNDDTNTGIYRSAADVIKIATGGTEALAIDSSQNATFVGSVTAYSFIKEGGTNTEFLKADGGVDSNTYLTTSSASSTYLPLAGGTLSGDLNIAEFIRHDQDSNTYLRFTADTLRLAAGGVEMIKLSEGTDDAIIFNEAGGDVDFRVEASGEANALFVRGSDGNVGIGTTTPNSSSKLHVHGQVRAIFDSNADFTTAAPTAAIVAAKNFGYGQYSPQMNGSLTVVNANTEGTAGFISLAANYGNTNNTIYSAAGIGGGKETTRGDGGWGGYLNFFTTSDGSAGAASGAFEHMRITADGNVGIGITSPNELLHVEDSSSSSGTSIAIQNAFGESPKNIKFRYNDTVETARIEGFGRNNTSQLPYLAFHVNQTTSSSASNDVAERMRIDSSGNVGIGDTTPSYKLDVNGTLRATSAAYFNNDVAVTNNLTLTGAHKPTFTTPDDTVYTPSHNWVTATPFNAAWHDLIAFDRNYTTTQEISTDGTNFSSDTLELGLFDQKDKANYVVIGSGERAVRWTWTGVAYNVARYFHIAATYSNPAPSCTVKIETSSDGSTWTEIHSSSGIAFSASNRFYYVDPYVGDGGDNYVRLTIDKGNVDTKVVRLSGIKMLTQRLGDQGKGREDELPFYYDKNQNIGLGITSPLRKLDLSTSSTTDAVRIKNTDSNGGGLSVFAANGGGGTNRILTLGDASENIKVAVIENGNVGIGTNSPTRPLEIYKTGTEAPLQVRSNLTTYTGIGFRESSGAGSDMGFVGIKRTDSPSSSDSEIHIRNSKSGTVSTSMMIDTSGNVGIGTTSPTDILTINETADSNGIRINGYDDESSSYLKMFVDNNGRSRIAQNTDGSSGYLFLEAEDYLQLIAGSFIYTTGEFRIYDAGQLSLGNGADFKIKYDNSTDKLNIHSSTNNGITMDTSGNVGIGTASPGYKLEIADDTDSTVNLLRLRNSDAGYSQSWDFQLDTSKDLVITGGSGSGGVHIVPGTRGLKVSGNIVTTSASNIIASRKFSALNTSGVMLTDSAGSNGLSIANGGDATFTHDLIVSGDLTVNGTTSTINSTTVQVDDKNIELGTVATPTDTTADGGGITLKGATDKTINWVNSTDAWTFSERVAITPDGSPSVPAITFSGDTDTGLLRFASGNDDTLGITTGGTLRAQFNPSGIVSSANVYSGTSGQFRNFAGVWKATTGATGNGFQFISPDATALTISSTGDATFAGNIHLDDDSSQLQFGDDNDMQIYHNGANGEINNSTGGFTIDSAADITLDAGGQDIILSDDGTIFGTLSNSSGLQIRSRVNNADMYLRGVDGGTEFTALRLDMSAGGVATFSSNVIVNGGQILTPSGTNLALNPNTGIVSVGGVIQCSGTGASTFAGDVTVSGDLTVSGEVEFSALNSASASPFVVSDGGTLGTRTAAEVLTDISALPLAGGTITGNVKFNDNAELRLGSGADLKLYHNGTTNNSNIENNVGGLYITNYADDSDIVFRSDDGSGGVTEYFRLAGNSTLTYFSKPLQMADSQKIFAGNGGDLQIYHNGTDSYLTNNITGSLYIQSGNSVQIESSTGENMIVASANGAVELYHDNAKKFETTSTGTITTGNVLATNNIYTGGANGFVFGSSTSEGEYIHRSGNDIR